MITKIVESRLGDNYDKKLDLFQKIEDLIKEYPDIETHVVEEIFGGKDKFDSYDVSKHKVNEVASLLGRVKRYVEDNVGYNKTQIKNESLKEDLDSEWRELETKQITDSDGFLTDYTLYTNGVTYICMYGDKDVYSPDIDEADYESDSEDEAYDWFNNYNGFDENYVDEGVNMVNKINESKLTEGRSYEDVDREILRLLEPTSLSTYISRYYEFETTKSGLQRLLNIYAPDDMDSFEFNSIRRDVRRVLGNRDVYWNSDDGLIIVDVTSFYKELDSSKESLT